jgi:hypothetical protein
MSQGSHHLRLHAILDGASIQQLLISIHTHYHRGLAGIVSAPLYALVARKMTERGESVIQATLIHYKKMSEGLSDGCRPPKGSATGATQTIVRHCTTAAGPNHPWFPAHIIRGCVGNHRVVTFVPFDHVFYETRSSRALFLAELQSVGWIWDWDWDWDWGIWWRWWMRRV